MSQFPTEAERVLLARKSVTERLTLLADEMDDDEDAFDADMRAAVTAALDKMREAVQEAEGSVEDEIAAAVDHADDYQRARDWEPR